MRVLLSLWCVLLVAGCTAQSWQKPMATNAGLQSDLATCSEAAQRESAAAAPHAIGPSRLTVGRTDIANPAADFPQELLLQQSLRNHCMRERGYALGQAAQLP